MSQYQNFPISTSTSISTKKNIQYSTRSVPVPPKYWQYQYLVPVQQILTKKAAKFENFEKKSDFYRWNSSLQEQFWIAVFEIKISKRSIWHTLKNIMAASFLQEICRFYLVGTGTDWLSTCVISTSTESVLENWTSTSTSTSVPKMISGLKKSVPVPVACDL